MRLAAASVLGLLLLAGCGDDPEVPDPTVDPGFLTPSGTGSPAPPAPAWTAEVLPFTFDGNLGTSAHGCVFPAGVCESRDVVAGSSDLRLQRPGANLTALSFDVSWTSQSPATQTLTVGAMVMASCDGCNSTTFDEVTGTSPLHLEASALSVPLGPDDVVHIYVYNPQGFVYNPAVPAYALVSVDQAFHVEGTLDILVPPA